MRALIVGNIENYWVIAEEVHIPGTTERFIVHDSRDGLRGRWVVTHLETSHVISSADDIDAAIDSATEKWQSAPREYLAERLAECRKLVAERMKEREVKK